MKKLLPLCSLLSLSACWSYNPTIIQGKVMESGTHLPISDISIVAYAREGLSKGPSRHVVAHIKTDSLGQYYFTLDLEPGFKYAYFIQTSETQQYKSSGENRFNLEEINQIDLFITTK